MSSLFYFFCVSIQLLFRWNKAVEEVERMMNEFQYNYCFGGTQMKFKTALQSLKCFNTTIVSVERRSRRIPIIIHRVSIQLLFRWNISGTSFIMILVQFQYNYCFGGTGTYSSLCVFFTAVSIQLLFRWNYGVKQARLWV